MPSARDLLERPKNRTFIHNKVTIQGSLLI